LHDTTVKLVSVSGVACSGTIITPRLILTANHCVTGTSGETGQPAVTPFQTCIQIGGDITPPIQGIGCATGSSGGLSPLSPRRDATAAPGPLPSYVLANVISTRQFKQFPIDDEPSHDVALLAIDEPLLQVGSGVVGGAPPEILAIGKPNFVGPGIAEGSTGPGNVTFGFRGWGSIDQGDLVLPNIRQAQVLFTSPDKQMSLHGTFPGSYWELDFISTEYLGTGKGDSGGPLYYGDGNSPSSQIGVSSTVGHDGSTDRVRWTNITDPDIAAWIDQTAISMGLQDFSGGTRPGRWLGEADYNLGFGCDATIDPDCDGFIDGLTPSAPDWKGDNCPGTYNPRQAGGPDSDGDGISDYCDNCPLDKNVTQVDSDGDGVGDACDHCAGAQALPACVENSNCPGATLNGISNKCVFRKNPVSGATSAVCGRLTDQDLDGVPDVCDNCLKTPNAPPVSGGAQDDADLDGLGDACDNCPGVGSLVPADHQKNTLPCSTGCTLVPGDFCNIGTGVCAAQLDFDNDGLGNVCDDCPKKSNTTTCSPASVAANCPVPAGESPAFCVTGGFGRPNACSRQADADGDGRGDVCDICPLNQNWLPTYTNINLTQVGNVNFDKDGDGLGDACDSCKSTKNTDPCLTDFNCPPGPGQYCVVATHVCALYGKQADDDGDLLGKACDNCPEVWNPKQENCNDYDESVQGLARRGDMCDPTPCANITADTVGDGSVSLHFTANVLPASKGGYPPKAPAAAVTDVRACACAENDIAFCANHGCPTGTANLDKPSWFHPSIQTGVQQGFPIYSQGPFAFAPVDPVSQDTHLGHELPKPLGYQDAGDTSEKLSWTLYNDVTANDWKNEFDGVLWTHVAAIASVPAGMFTQQSNHYAASNFGYPAPPPDGVCIKGTGNKYCALCPECEFSFQLDGNPNGPPCPFCSSPSAGPSIFLVGLTDGVAFLRTPGRDIDVTSAIAPSALASMLTPGTRWVGVSEQPDELAGTRVGYVGLSPDGTRVASVLGNEGGGFGVLHPRGDVGGGGAGGRDGGRLAATSLTADASPTADGPSERVNFGAATSAVEEALYVVGGQHPTSHKLLRDVWRYDLNDQSWSHRPLSGEHPGKVLAATYRATDRALYVVDEVGWPIARMLRIDVDRGHSEVLFYFPVSSGVDQLFLSNGFDRELILIQTSTSRHRTWGVTFEPVGGGCDHVRLDRHFTVHAVATLPASTDALGLGLAVVDPALGVAPLRVPAKDLKHFPKDHPFDHDHELD
jgi:hypothetical protein